MAVITAVNNIYFHVSCIVPANNTIILFKSHYIDKATGSLRLRCAKWADFKYLFEVAIQICKHKHVKKPDLINLPWIY